jgi:hypothetical protein
MAWASHRARAKVRIQFKTACADTSRKEAPGRETRESAVQDLVHSRLRLSHQTYGYCWRTYFTTDKAEMSAGVAPSLGAFRGGMGEATCRRFRVRQQYPTLFCDSPFSHKTTGSDFIEGLGVLTAVRVRYIRFPLSWRLRALIMGIGKTARKSPNRVIRAKEHVNRWFRGPRWKRQ